MSATAIVLYLIFFLPCSALSYCIFIFLIMNTLMYMNEYYTEETLISCERKKVKTYTMASPMCIEILLPWSRLASLGGKAQNLVNVI